MATKAKFSSGAHYDAEIAKYDQQECEVLRKLRPDEVDEEVGDMFHIRFADGTEIDVFADELPDFSAELRTIKATQTLAALLDADPRRLSHFKPS